MGCALLSVTLSKIRGVQNGWLITMTVTTATNNTTTTTNNKNNT